MLLRESSINSVSFIIALSESVGQAFLNLGYVVCAGGPITVVLLKKQAIEFTGIFFAPPPSSNRGRGDEGVDGMCISES